MKRLLIFTIISIFCLNNLLAQKSPVASQKGTISTRAETDGVMGKAYWDLWNSEFQAKIDQNIEKYRKANAYIILKGVPEGTEVKVEQREHDFEFGANIFNFDQLGSTRLNEKYKELFGTLFNSATIPFYWKTFEPKPGKPRYKASFKDSEEYWNRHREPWKEYHWRRPAPEKIIEFCELKNIHMHGHPLIWGNTKWNHPSWISKDSDKVTEMERLFNKRITEICNYYNDRIPSWDIVNESVDPTPGEPRYGVIPDDYTFKSFKLAEKLFPESVKMCINDSWRPVYPPFIQDLISRGAKIDVVGLQMHIFDSQSCLDVADGKTVFPNKTSWKPQDVIRYLESLDSLQRPIHLSEITIPSPGNAPVDDEIQAVIARDMYRLWFSWPSIYRITWWNVVDDCGAPGEPSKSGLFTRSMEPKPAFYTLDNLINHEWKTNITVSTEENGIVKFRGFRGQYRLSWRDKSGKEQQVEFYLRNDGDGL
jgi:GH35 family endo-1,4-beta-xylanase